MKVVLVVLLVSGVAVADPFRVGVLAETGRDSCWCTYPRWTGGELALERPLRSGFMVGGALDLRWYTDTDLDVPFQGIVGDVVATAGFYSPDSAAVPWLHAFAAARLGIVAVHGFGDPVENGVGYIPGVDLGVDLGAHATRFRAELNVSFPSTFDQFPQVVWVTIGAGLVLVRPG